MTAVPLAFAALTVALAALWAPRLSSSPSASYWWGGPFVVALLVALAGGLVDARGVLALAVFGGACYIAPRASNRALAVVAHVLMLVMSAGLLLHILPGFQNPRVLSDVVLSPGSMPYTKYLNFDKGVAGLFLLGLYATDLPAGDEGRRHVLAFLWRVVAMAVVVMTLSLAFGYVRWDPKLPPWWPLWAWCMVFLTALPEEAVFRGVAQTGSRDGWEARRGQTPLRS